MRMRILKKCRFLKKTKVNPAYIAGVNKETGKSIYNSLFHSKGSTSAGLLPFLLGGFSCIILLGSVFLYANCGITSLDTERGIWNDLFHSISYGTESIKQIYPEPSFMMSSIVYTLANTPKALVLKENKGKSGIYL
jgi:hypothetical protein